MVEEVMGKQEIMEEELFGRKFLNNFP